MDGVCLQLVYNPTPRTVIDSGETFPNCGNNFQLTQEFVNSVFGTSTGTTTGSSGTPEGVVVSLDVNQLSELLNNLFTEFNPDFFGLILAGMFGAMTIGITGGWIYKSINRASRW